jgi:ubiquinone biosynthesis protein COQ9
VPTQERYLEILMKRVREDRYPSGQMLDRIEAALATAEQYHVYLEFLLDKADQAWYMSPQLLDRIQRLLLVAAAA